jgi:hypothetical protein
MFIASTPLGLSGKANQGESYFGTENPAIGTVITYIFNDTTLISEKDARKKKDAALAKAGKDVPYPSLDELHKEDWENAPYLLATITSADGEVVRRLKINKPSQGFNRLVWDFRYEALVPVQLQTRTPGRYEGQTMGALATPGTYYVQFHKIKDGKLTEMSAKTAFVIKSLNNVSLPAADKAALTAFSVKMVKMRRAVRGAAEVFNTQSNRVKHLQKAVLETPGAELKTLERLEKLHLQLKTTGITLYGDGSLASREFAVAPGLLTRIETAMDNFLEARSAAPASAERHYAQAADIFEQLLKDLKTMDKEIAEMEQEMYKLGAPYTQGSDFVPDWKKE